MITTDHPGTLPGPELIRRIRFLFDTCAAIALDFDGVLADSEQFQLDIWTDLFLEKALEPSGLCIRAIEGRTDEDLVRSVLPRQTPEVYAALVREKRRRCTARFTQLRPVPGAADFLQAVCNAKRLFVCSSSHRQWIERFLRHFFPSVPIELLVTAEDVSSHKPHPEPYMTLLQKAALDRDQILVIEDSPPGLAAAIAAGLPVIHLDRHGDHPSHVPTVTDFQQLLTILFPGQRIVSHPSMPHHCQFSTPTHEFSVFLSFNFGPAGGHELALIRRLAGRRRVRIVTVVPGHGASDVATLIRRAVAGSDGLLAVLHSESEWCQAEIAMAVAFDLPVYVLSSRQIKGIASHVTSYKIIDLSDPANLKTSVEKALQVLGGEMDRRRARLPEQPATGEPVLEYRWDSYVALIERAKRQLLVSPADGGFRPTLILGISRGGIIVADILARLLMDVPLGLLSAVRSAQGAKFDRRIVRAILQSHRRGTGSALPRVLVVDDVVKSGITLACAYEQVRAAMDAVSRCSSTEVLRTLALIVQDSNQHVGIPHYAVERVGARTNLVLPYGLG